jgi:hypothetical protein
MSKKSVDEVHKIHLIPYSHHDHAWTNTRQWHIRRYLEGFCEVLDLMKEKDDYTLVVDNVAHSLEAFEKYCPSRREELKQRVREGRIAVLNGGFALVRPNYSGDELYIRNLIEGRRGLRRCLDPDELTIFFNADTAVGHSQLPQILTKSGHKHYRFFRPESALDAGKVPREFIWEGLDGSRIISSRGPYGGFLFGEYLKNGLEDWKTVRDGFVDEDIGDKLPLSSTADIYLNVGCDDVLPLRNLFDEKIDLYGLLNKWNKMEKSRMAFSTPYEFHKTMEKSSLPVVKGVLDPCDLSFNAPWRSEGSLWRQRLFCDRLLVTAERMSMLLQAVGGKANYEYINSLWRDLMHFSGHAMELLLSDDFDEALSLAVTTNGNARRLIADIADSVAIQSKKNSPVQYTVVNPCGFERKALVPLHITSPFNMHAMKLKDPSGKELDYQITDTYDGDKAYKGKDYNEISAVCMLTMPPMGYTSVAVEFNGGSLLSKVSEEIPTDERCFDSESVIDNGLLKTDLLNGRIKRIVEKNSGMEVFGRDSKNDFGALRFYHTTPTENWTSNWDDLMLDSFVADSCVYLERGPLRYRYAAYGMIGENPVRIETVFETGMSKISFHVEVENKGGEGYFAVTFPCDKEPHIVAGIPFGAEERNTANISYGKESDSGPLYFERGCMGGFFAKHFTAFDLNGFRCALLQGDCSIYYRNRAFSGEIELILMKSLCMEHRTEKWFEKVHKSIDGRGKQSFSFSLCILDRNVGMEEIIKLSEGERYPAVVTPRYSYEQGNGEALFSAFSVEGGSLRLSAVYQENNEYVLRLYECAGKIGSSSINVALPVSDAYRCNLLGERDENSVTLLAEAGVTTLLIEYSKWEIVNIRWKARLE